MNCPWFPHNPGEWVAAAASAGLTSAEEGALIRLYNFCWLDPQCSLPSLSESIATMSGLKKSWVKSQPRIMARLAKHPTIEGRLTIPSLYDAMVHADNKSDKARQNIAKRWERTKYERNTDVIPTKYKSDTMRGEERREEKSTPIAPADAGREGVIEEPKAKTLRMPKTPSIPFADFWVIYPRKVGKGAAEKAWAKVNPDPSLFERICDALAEQRQSEAWRKDGGQFVPHPATWLNQQRWEDSTAIEVDDLDDDEYDGPGNLPPIKAMNFEEMSTRELRQHYDSLSRIYDDNEWYPEEKEIYARAEAREAEAREKEAANGRVLR